MKKPPTDQTILAVVKAARPVNKKSELDIFSDQRVGDLAIENCRLVKFLIPRGGSKADEKPVPLFMNGSALIDYEIVSDDGIIENRYFVMVGKLQDGRDLPPIKVMVAQFPSMAWPLQWGNKLIVSPGAGNKDNARAAIQVLSGDVRTEREYRHTGWRHIDGSWHFLSGSGALNTNGLDATIRVELDEGNLKLYRLPSPSDETKRRALLLLDLLAIAPNNPAVGVALVCAVCRAPLAELAAIDFSLFFAGQSGSQKSEIAALALGFFGDFNARAFPANFSDTESDMTHKSHQAKDCVFVVDEFCAATSQQDTNKIHAKAETMFRSVGNQQGRGRRNSDMTGKAAYHPRGMVVSTGEDTPRGASLLGRILICELKRGDVDLALLSDHQTQRHKGHHAEGMAAYIQWLSTRMDDLKRDFPAKITKLRDEAIVEGFAKSHPRAADIYASLLAGYDVFLDFLVDAEIIGEVRANDLLQSTSDTLKIAIMAQAEFQQQSDDVQIFRDLLQSCFSSNRVHVACHLKQGPPQLNEHLWGWRANERDGEVMGRGDLIGSINEAKQQIWLDPESTFAAVQRLAHTQGEAFLLSKATLWKRMLEKNMLLEAETDKKSGKPRPTVKRTVCGKSARVLVLPLTFITNTDTPL